MPRIGFEPTTPVFQRVTRFNTVDRSATVIGINVMLCLIKELQESYQTSIWKVTF
jgi:hypothetical protein